MVSRIVIISLFVVAAATAASAATAISRLPPIPKEFAHKKGCYIKEVNDVVPFGTELKPLGICLRLNCGERFIDYASCGVVSTDDPKCHITDYDYTKPYPNCCPDITCDDINDIDSNNV